MALISTCRRGALQQRPYLQVILAENRFFSSSLQAQGRGDSQAPEDKSSTDRRKKSLSNQGQTADTPLDSSAQNEPAVKSSWTSPFSTVLNLVDKKLDYFRPAYAVSGTKASTNGRSVEKSLVSEDAEHLRGSLGGDEGAHASTSSGVELSNVRRRLAKKVAKGERVEGNGRSARASGESVLAAEGRLMERSERNPTRPYAEKGENVAEAFGGDGEKGLRKKLSASLRAARPNGKGVGNGFAAASAGKGDQVQHALETTQRDLGFATTRKLKKAGSARAVDKASSSGRQGDGGTRKGGEASAVKRGRKQKGASVMEGSESAAGETSIAPPSAAKKGRSKKEGSESSEVEAKESRPKGRGRKSSSEAEEVTATSEDGFVRVTAKAPDVNPPKQDESSNGARKKRVAKKAVKAKSKVPPLPDSRALYAEMLEREKGEKTQPLLKIGKEGGKENALAIVKRFVERGWASDQALALYVNHELYPVVAARFKKLVLKGCTEELKQWFLQVEPSDEAEEALFPLFAELCLQEFREELRHFRKLVESANLTEPEKWYPYARAMKRKIIYHCGPTNSGKTYEALQRLKQADNGMYCGPLRLLAMEIFDTLNADGVYCNLTTGQERRTVPFANHTSCTVEMAHLGNEYEVGVIDEIQMMADSHRGWAWTRAFLGLQAKEIHVCGDSSVLQMLNSITKTCGDELVVHNYERWKELSVEGQSLGGSWKNVGEGDCVVAFSRKEIFQIKEEIEAQGNHKCCVIYGALPPETRRQQAKLFNDPDSGYNVLVASDAIGMGLNLNIRRMVFSKMEKFSGGATKDPIPHSMVKQIAGRAGRRNSSHPEGLATTFLPDDLPKLREAMAAPMETATKGGLFPIFEQMELFAGQLPEVTFPDLLDKFAETSLLDSSYSLCKHDQIRTIALLLEKVPTLTLRDRFSLCQAPINSRSLEAMSALLQYAKAYAEGGPVPLEVTFREWLADIAELEWKHQVVSAYLWLSYQLKETQFPHRAKAEQLLASMVELLDRRLAGSVHKRPRLTQRPMAKKPFVSRFSTGGDSLLGRLRSSENEDLEGPRIAATL